MKTVYVYYITEDEASRALNILHNPTQTPAFVRGGAGVARRRALKRSRLRFEVLANSKGVIKQFINGNQAFQHHGPLDPRGLRRSLSRLHLTQFLEPNTSFQHLPEALSPEALAVAVQPLWPNSTKVWPLLEPSDQKRPFDLRLGPGQTTEELVACFQHTSIEVTASTPRRVRVLASSNELNPLIGVQIFGHIEPVGAASLHNNLAKQLTGVTPPPLGGDEPLTGLGQILAMADAGVGPHPDLAGRVSLLRVSPTKALVHSESSHGTHVAGILIGDGLKSDGELAGVAPEATLLCQNISDGAGKIVPPVDLYQMLLYAYEQGARIHTNSWGLDGTAGAYTAACHEIDLFVYDHPNMLVLFSAGNEGTATSRHAFSHTNTDLCLQTITAPATARNVLAVGASCSSRTTGGQTGSFITNWSDRFKANSLGANLSISGAPEQVAPTSGRGPTQTFTLKPDLVAPGTNILSTCSGENYLQVLAPGDYAFLGGTSMAVPHVAGVAALIRQHYLNQGHNPSAALLRATLVAGARHLTGDSANQGHKKSRSHQGNMHQGFGLVDLSNTLPAGRRALRFYDQQTSLPAEQSVRFTLEDVQTDQPLRVCLVWTDAPGLSLQHHLQLQLHHVQSNTSFFANDNTQRFPRSVLIDRSNNVHIYANDAPKPGKWQLKVSTSFVSEPYTQRGFALVVLGQVGELRRL